VASPKPLRIVEQDSITGLLDAGSVVICGGGGGAAVTENAAGQLSGVDAVVDKTTSHRCWAPSLEPSICWC